MTEQEKIQVMDKIRKCLALADDKAATEAEAATAAAMAQALLERYNLSIAEMDSVEDVERIDTHDLFQQSRFQAWETSLFTRLAKLYGCHPFRKTTRNYGKHTVHLMVAGFAADVEVFKYTFEFLRKTIGDLGTKDLAHGKKIGWVRSRSDSITYKASFCRGCVTRIADILKAERDTRHSFNVKTKDLVIVKDAQVKNWVRQNLNLRRGQTRHQSNYDDYAAGRGRNAAEGIGIRPAVRGVLPMVF